MSDYPIPSYAANIWIAGDLLWLGFPPIGDGVQAHSVSFPANERGLSLIIEILKSRRKGERMIGENGSPTRYQVERELVRDAKYNELLRALENSKKVTAEEAAEASAFLEELGL